MFSAKTCHVRPNSWEVSYCKKTLEVRWSMHGASLEWENVSLLYWILLKHCPSPKLLLIQKGYANLFFEETKMEYITKLKCPS